MYIKFANDLSEVVTYLHVPDDTSWALRAVPYEDNTHELRLNPDHEGEPDHDWASYTYPPDLYLCAGNMVYPLGYTHLQEDFEIYLGDFFKDCVNTVYAKLAADPTLQSIDLSDLCNRVFAKHYDHWIRKYPKFAEYQEVDPNDLPENEFDSFSEK